MNTLFPIEPLLPEGFSYQENFITIEEEQSLIDVCKQLPLHNLIFQGFEAKRKVMSYGYDYNFDKRSITRGEPIPEQFDFLLEKVAKHTNTSKNNFGEVLVTEYPPGSVINWHRDAPPFDFIVGISLLTACLFKLRPYDKAKQNRRAVISIEIQPRSLYVMKDASRSEWEHSTAPVKDTRYSITLRTLR